MFRSFGLSGVVRGVVASTSASSVVEVLLKNGVVVRGKKWGAKKEFGIKDRLETEFFQRGRSVFRCRVDRT